MLKQGAFSSTIHRESQAISVLSFLAESAEQQKRLEEAQSEAAVFLRRAEAADLALATVQVGCVLNVC